MIRSTPFFLLILLGLWISSPPVHAQCSQMPQIGSSSEGIAPFPEIDEDRAVVQYNDACEDERWTKVWLLEDGERPALLQQDGYDTDGWRTLEIRGLRLGKQYCVAVETPQFLLPLTVKACFKTVYAPRVYPLDPVSNPLCGNPSKPSSSSLKYREHVYLSEIAAEELGIDPAMVSDSGPSPQVRILIDANKVDGDDHPSAIYTVAGICTDSTDKPNRFWVWETSKLFGDAPPELPVRAKKVSPLAPHQTLDPLPVKHYTDPNDSTQHFQEAIESADDNQVLVMAPHGGFIESGTSEQIPFFRATLSNANVGSSFWNVTGKWGSSQTFKRWHITSTALHPFSFPGLDALLSVHGSFDTAVAFHGCSSTCPTPNYGVVIGGGTDRANKCHVAQRIEELAVGANRGGEIAYLIAASDPQDDINLPSIAPALDLAQLLGTNLSKLRGVSPDNIVNRVSGGNGIQLEQTQPLRTEENCGDGCLKDLVARGTALAVDDMLNGAVPANACQF